MGFAHWHKDSHMLSPVRGMLAQFCQWLLRIFGWLQHRHTHTGTYLCTKSWGTHTSSKLLHILLVCDYRFLQILTMSTCFFHRKINEVYEVFWLVWCYMGNSISSPSRKLHPQFWCSDQAHKQCTHTHITHTDSGYFHATTHIHTHTHHSTQALSISALTIGSLCWAGWDVRMNQCEDSWLDMPIHLPKKRERKRERGILKEMS